MLLCIQALAKRLNSDFGGSAACFRGVYFRPTFFKYHGTTVPGVQWFPTRVTCSIFASATYILCALRDLSIPKEAFVWDGVWFGHPGAELIDQYAGTPKYREMIDSGLSAQEIIEYFKRETSLFVTYRQQFFLYM